MANVLEKGAAYTTPEDVTTSRAPVSGLVAGLIASGC